MLAAAMKVNLALLHCVLGAWHCCSQKSPAGPTLSMKIYWHALETSRPAEVHVPLYVERRAMGNVNIGFRSAHECDNAISRKSSWSSVYFTDNKSFAVDWVSHHSPTIHQWGLKVMDLKAVCRLP